MGQVVWVGGRVAGPFFVEAQGGYQPDIAVWMDAGTQHVVGMEVIHPGDADSCVLDALRAALKRPIDGTSRRPGRLRVADPRLAELVAAVKLPVEIGPTPEIDRMIETMGETMPGAGPRLAEFRSEIREKAGLVKPLLQAAGRLLEVAPWSILWDTEAFRLDVPELDISNVCVSVMGRAETTWGLSMLPSVDAFRRLSEARDVEAGKFPDLGDEGVFSLTFAEQEEVPAVIRRELHELGWAAGNLVMYPAWYGATRDGKARVTTDRELRILFAATAGVAGHVSRYRDELAEGIPPERSDDYRVDGGGTTLTARITAPHPEIPWRREAPRATKRSTKKSGPRRKRRR